MKSRVLSKRLVAIIMTAAMIVTGPGFSLSALGATDSSAANAVSEQSQEQSVNDSGKTAQEEESASLGNKAKGDAAKDDEDTSDDTAKDESAKNESAKEDGTADEKSSQDSKEDSDSSDKEKAAEKDEPVLVNKTIEAKDNNYEITVKGKLPEDAGLVVKEITDKDQIDKNGKKYNDFKDYQKSAVKEVSDKEKDFEGDSLPYTRLFDITIKYDDGKKEYQPDESVQLKIDTKDDSLKDEDLTFKTLHFKDNDNYIEGEDNDELKYDADIMSSKIENKDTFANKFKGDKDKDKELTLKTDSFSVYGVVYYYTVDFYYSPEVKEGETAIPSEYHMNGGSEMKLSELFKELNIDKNPADVDKIDFTNEDLVAFTKAEDSSDWNIKSLKPFTSSEVLTITFKNGKEIKIGVEDAIGPNEFGTNLTWEISDSGALTIKPKESGEAAVLPKQSGGTTTTPPDNLDSIFPWHADEYRETIKSIVIEEGVSTSSEARYMFYNLPNLTTADLSNLDANDLGCTNDMFKSCGNLKKVTFSSNFMPKQMNRAFQNCSALTTITFGTKDKPFDPASVSRSNYNNPFGDLNANMFTGCTSLTTLEFPNAKFDNQNGSTTQNVPKLLNLFNSANNNSAKTLDVSGAEIGPWMSKRIFQGSNLETVKAEGTTIDHTLLRELFHSDQSGTIPAGSKLKTVDMTSAKFVNEGATAWRMFNAISSLEKVYLTDAEFNDNCSNFTAMFKDCSSLQRVEMNDEEKKFSIKGAVQMENMFQDCSNLEYLDISGWGKLENIVTVNNVLGGCYALETLIIDNLDNSVLQPRRGSEHEHNSDGRRFFGYYPPEQYFTNLKTLSAKNSKFWFVKSDSVGLPGEEPYLASNENDLYYLTKNVTEFTGDNGKKETIDSKRDWIDLITDRYGKSTGALTIPDAEQNINSKDGHMNTNGAGFLAPGVYNIGDDPWEEPDIQLEETFYRISNINNSAPTVTLSDSEDRINDDSGHITTKVYPKDSWTDGTVGDMSENDCTLKNEDGSALITLTYPDAAEDIYGKKHDVVLTINAITYKNLDRIKTDPNITHDPNTYVTNEYKRDILNYGQGFLQFRNYVLNDSGSRFISGGSGTYIDYDISIKDALPDTSVLFYMEDLDVPAKQDYTEGKDPQTGDYDWHFQELPFENNTWGPGSEGMILGNGNDLNTVRFADHTGLEIVNGNEIVSTGGDPITSWSAFCVRANAKKSNYTWTSGVACDTYLLKQTDVPKKPQPVYVMPEALKRVNSKVPSGTYESYFDFDFKKAAGIAPQNYSDYLGRQVDVSGLDNQATDQTQKNNKKGTVVFDTLELVGSDNNAKKLYLYEISEEAGDTTGDVIKYDDTKYYMQVVVSDPVTDLEMYKGTRAEIIIGTKYGDNPVIWDKNNVITVWANDAQKANIDGNGPHGEQVFKDANGTLFYRDSIDGELKPYGSSKALTPASRSQVSRKVFFNKEKKEKQVKVDHNGVTYIKGDDGNYYDPDDENILRTPKTGDIDPDKTYKDHVVPIKKTIEDDGNKEVRKDIHGIEYYVKDGKYYDTDKNQLTVKDGVFNPDTSDDGDKYVYENKQHEYNGQKYDVYKHFNGKEYFIVKSGNDEDYYNPANDQTWQKKSEGDVDPQDSDPDDTTDKAEYKERKETVTGRGNTIKRDKNGVEYFKNVRTEKKTPNGDTIYKDQHNIEYYEKDGKYYSPDGTELTVEEGTFEPSVLDDPVMVGDDKYYTPYNTLLVVNEGTFEPDDDTDKPVYHTYEVWTDSEGNEFYKNERKYFDMSGKEVKLSDGTLDTSEIVNIGTFKNEIKTADITIKKEVEGGKAETAGKFKFHVTFDNDYDPLKEAYEYSTATTYVPTQVSKKPNTWEFIVEEGQSVKIKRVPLQTKYSIKEIPENGYELSKIETGNDKIPGEVKNVTISKRTDGSDSTYKGDYEHTFTNKITQMIVDKKITNVPEGKDVSKYVFSYTAVVTKPGTANEGDTFGFGWLQKDNSNSFKTAEYKNGKWTNNTITFTLKDKEDIALVIPDGADVKITESNENLIGFTKLDDQDDDQLVEGYTREVTNVKNPTGTGDLKTVHYVNKYVLPVDYQMKAEKVIENHPFMSGYKFEMALIPSEHVHTPLPQNSEEVVEDGIYAPTIITANPEKETTDHAGYWNNFKPITFTNEDMMELKTLYSYNGTKYSTEQDAVDAARADGKGESDVTESEEWVQVPEKTFTYYIRELPPSESSLQDGTGAPGLTYSTQRYQADVKVKLNKQDAKLELEVESTTIYGMNYDEATQKWVVDKSKKYDAARFINKFDPNKNAYRMVADKVFTSTDNTKDLEDGDYNFFMKPVGNNAAKAPMPVRTQGQGEGRYLEVTNNQHMIRFFDQGYVDEQGNTDGLVFDHQKLNDAGFTDEMLESESGVSFEYELWEKIPDGAKNNNDGTLSLTDKNGNTTVYDGIHHMRKLVVRLIDNPDYDQTKPENGPKKILEVTGHHDSLAEDYYIDSNGDKPLASTITGYDPNEHHTKGGAPIFHNYYFHQEEGEIVIKKNWDDYDDMDEIRPDTIHVTVTGDESNPTKKTATLKRDEHGHWTATVSGLPVYSDKFNRETRSMEKVKYTVEEVQEGVIDGTAEGYVISYDTEMPIELYGKDTSNQDYKPVEVTVINRHMPIPGAAESDETWGLKNQPQRGIPDYEVVSTDPMEPQHLVVPSDIEGAHQDKEGWVIIPGEGKYFLNKDDVRSVTFIPEKDYVGDPTPIKIHCKDKLDNEQDVTYTPHVVEPKIEEETISRTIHYNYVNRLGKQVVPDVEQSVTISRIVTAIDPKTGEITEWSDWSKGVLPALPNPDEQAGPGWSTTDKVTEITIDKPVLVDDVYVIYTKDVYKVTYKDGDHGKSNGGSVDKEYGDVPQSNTVTPDNGYVFTGEYDYVITDKSGKEIEKGKTKDPQSIKVTGNIVFTPTYEKEHYTVTYLDGDHGKSNGGKEDKTYGDTPQNNKVTPANGYKFTGEYEYVITDKSGKEIAKGKTKDPQSIKVTGNIVFTPLYEKENYTVTYVNGKHGKSNGGKVSKEYGDTPQSNSVKASKGYKFTGEYSYVITDNNGKVIKRGKTKDPQSIEVIGNIVFTPVYAKASPEKKKDKKDKKQNVKRMAKGKASKTGDDSNMMPFALMMIGSIVVIGLLALARRRKE